MGSHAQPIVAHGPPDIFLRIEFGAFRRQGQRCDVGRNHQPARQMPACLEHDGDSTKRHRALMDLYETDGRNANIFRGASSQRCVYFTPDG